MARFALILNERIGTMKLSIKILLTALIGVVVGCSGAPDKIGNLDLKKWRGDRGGCNGVRKGLEGDFKSVEKELKGEIRRYDRRAAWAAGYSPARRA
ncbi:hypothetical protein [Dyadobacter sp. 676]|uniref:Lipoprotein n=1 Tax=Dyadobacter sp. 676 TaxID=3088362 RepID=A0AAU8FS47_9BACT